jgi:hypothetical protein
MNFSFLKNAFNTIVRAVSRHDMLEEQYNAAAAEGLVLPSFKYTQSVLICDRDTQDVLLIGREPKADGYSYHAAKYSIDGFTHILEKDIQDNNQALMRINDLFSIPQTADDFMPGTNEKHVTQRLQERRILEAALPPHEIRTVLEKRAAIEKTIALFEKEALTGLHDDLRDLHRSLLSKESAAITHINSLDLAGDMYATSDALVRDLQDSGHVNGGEKTTAHNFKNDTAAIAVEAAAHITLRPEMKN